MPGALEFARVWQPSKGVTVFYLSNRASDLAEATLDNLRKRDFPIAEGEPVFLGLGTIVSGCEQNGSEKGCRRELISRNYRVLMQVGDQIGDFVDVVANTPDGRRQAVAPYLDWIGERWFVLPNPDLRLVGTGAVQQRLEPAGRSASPGQIVVRCDLE